MDKANNLWMALKQQGYEQWLTKEESGNCCLFSQRLLFEHKGGIVDAKYISMTDDADHRIGDRLVVNENDVVLLGIIVQKTIDAINQF